MTTIEIFTVVASMLGGLALFLFGMNTLSDSLSTMTGGVLDKVLGKITKNSFFGFLFGAGITAVVQSSSAITVLSVGLVNSGIIGLKQAASLIIGANLGTTATAWVLSLNALDGESLLMTIVKPAVFSPFLAIIGVALTMFAKSQAKKNIGNVLLGFAVMMIGMNLMSQAVAPLKEMPALQGTLMSFTNPILGFGFAMLFTMLVQSSDAVIGIVQAFALSVGVTFGMAIPLICGAHVGTCITALLSSMGASRNGKRTALVNLFYNLLKTIPFLVVFYILNSVFHFSFMEASVGAIGIPIFHTAINALACLIWLPGSGALVALAKKTLPYDEKEKEEMANQLTMLDENLLGNPRFALEQADKAVLLLGRTAGESLATISTFRENPNCVEDVQRLCHRAEQFEKQIDKYLVEIATHTTRGKDAAYISLLTNANTAFATIGRVTEQILEKCFGFVEKSGKTIDDYPESEQIEAKVFHDAYDELLELTFEGFEKKLPSISQTVMIYREEISNICGIVRRRHVRHMHGDEGRQDHAELLTNMSYVQEKLVDLCDSVADAVIRYLEETGGYVRMSEEEFGKKSRQIKALFADKYEMLGVTNA
ncbi:MAG: Na/Pi cotransporter family protein [Eubacterium sp.]|nr:Na/Pi cotransporter family protein [Eubacterium sp.]